MGHMWTWLESKREFFTDSEKSSSCQSFCDSPDSSVDLEMDLGSWRETEETSEEDLEENSSQEVDGQSETEDPPACEKASTRDQEEAEVTYLMEPLYIDGINLAQSSQALGAAGGKNGKGCLTDKEDTKDFPAPIEEEVGEESNFHIFKKHDREDIDPQRNWPFQASKSLPVIHWQADGTEEPEHLYEQPEDSQIQNSKFHENSGKSAEEIEESVEEMEDEDSSSEYMNQTSCSWGTLKEEIPQSVKEEVSVENTEEQAEDWKDSDFHLSYSNDDSSPWGTPLMSSPSTSTPPLPLMQLSQDDSLQQCLLFKKTLLSIWKMVAGHRYSGPFLKAVSEKQAPGYKDVVKRPVDLSSIKRSLSKGQIQNMIQFQRDLMLMFQNAIMYNTSNHHIHRIAVEMQQEVLEQLQMLGEALLCSEEMQGFLRRS